MMFGNRNQMIEVYELREVGEVWDLRWVPHLQSVPDYLPTSFIFSSFEIKISGVIHIIENIYL